MTPRRHHEFDALFVEDDPVWAKLLSGLLEHAEGWHFKLHHVGTLQAALQWLSLHEPPDVVILDMQLPDASDLQGLKAIHDAAPKLPVVMLTSVKDEQLVTEALRGGAQDYLQKGQELSGEAIGRSLYYAIERQGVRSALYGFIAELEEQRSKLLALLKAAGLKTQQTATGLGDNLEKLQAVADDLEQLQVRLQQEATGERAH